MQRKFTKENYEKYDNKGKEAAISFVKALYPSAKVIEKEERYKEGDVTFLINGVTIIIETEIRERWYKGLWRFWDVQLPQRKQTYKTTNYWFIFSKDCNGVMILGKENINNCTPIVKDTFCTNDEIFNSYNKNLWKQWIKKEGKWEKIG